MCKKMFILIAVIVNLLAGGSLEASDYVPGELLVKYKPGMVPGHLQGGLAKLGWGKIRVKKGESLTRAMRAFKKDGRVMYVEPNYYGRFLSQPNDPDFDKQWYLTNISAPEAWDKSLGSGVTIGLVDSGVDLDHPDLADNLLPDGWDFGDNDADPSDEQGHGTKVCGIIAALRNNLIGISGTAPESLVLPLKINKGGDDLFEASALAEAIQYAADYGVKIINLSLGWSGGAIQVVTDAVDYAASRGVLLVAAAGNGGPVWFPASLDQVIAVSATDSSNTLAAFSSFGPEIELAAPGELIYTTNPGGSVTIANGTSFSAPIVSAVAALISWRNPCLGADRLREYLVESAQDLGSEGRDEWYGYGKVNALGAVVMAADSCAPMVNISPSSAMLKAGETKQFSAATSCDGCPLDETHTWNISAGSCIGSAIDSTGFYSAPGMETGSCTDTIQVSGVRTGEQASASVTVSFYQCDIEVIPRNLLRLRSLPLIWPLPLIIIGRGTDCRFAYGATEVEYTPDNSVSSLLTLPFPLVDSLWDWVVISPGDESTTVSVTVTSGSNTTGSDTITVNALPLWRQK